MRILTAAGMAETDRRTVALGTPISVLMENAGAATARFCQSHYRRARHIVAICGKGNNGGDGLVAARILAEAGRQVSVLLLARVEELKGEPAAAAENIRAAARSVQIFEAPDENALRDAIAQLGAADLVLDAVVGTGFRPPLRGVATAARDWLTSLRAPVVAVDLPSGWDADSTAQDAPEAFPADAVVTFTAQKPAHVFGYMARPRTSDGAWPFGPVVVAEIGSPADAIRDSAGKPELCWAGSSRSIADEPRPVNSNKGKFGHVLVVAGSSGTAGAPSMASLAALRAGAGLVTAAVPNSIADTVALAAVELMISPLEQGPEGAVSLRNLDSGAVEVILRDKRISVVAIGPGLSTRGDAPEFARTLVSSVRLPMVVDADALNAFAGKADLLKLAAKGRTLVLTPHPGEMARLAGLTIAQVEADRVALARRFATEHGVILVLKGWRTLIAHPDGRVAVNTSGNPSMAKGGSGDILTGIVAAMLAQYPESPAEAVEAAVYLHGFAGDYAARRMDQHTVLATDTLKHLSDAFRQPARDRNGFVWIAGMAPRGGRFRGTRGARGAR
jgi:hydroxyethylthiazole kinase-like uncharacterized protein yjeF